MVITINIKDIYISKLKNIFTEIDLLSKSLSKTQNKYYTDLYNKLIKQLDDLYINYKTQTGIFELYGKTQYGKLLKKESKHIVSLLDIELKKLTKPKQIYQEYTEPPVIILANNADAVVIEEGKLKKIPIVKPEPKLIVKPELIVEPEPELIVEPEPLENFTINDFDLYDVRGGGDCLFTSLGLYNKYLQENKLPMWSLTINKYPEISSDVEKNKNIISNISDIYSPYTDIGLYKAYNDNIFKNINDEVLVNFIIDEIKTTNEIRNQSFPHGIEDVFRMSDEYKDALKASEKTQDVMKYGNYFNAFGFCKKNNYNCIIFDTDNQLINNDYRCFDKNGFNMLNIKKLSNKCIDPINNDIINKIDLKIRSIQSLNSNYKTIILLHSGDHFMILIPKNNNIKEKINKKILDELPVIGYGESLYDIDESPYITYNTGGTENKYDNADKISTLCLSGLCLGFPFIIIIILMILILYVFYEIYKLLYNKH